MGLGRKDPNGWFLDSGAGRTMKDDDLNWVKTHCARMDHGGCALLVGVKGGRIIRIKGDPDGFLNCGYVCAKAIASPHKLTHPDRLRHPVRRKGGRGEGKWEKKPLSQ